MIDEKSRGDAAFYVLDLLEPPEMSRFEDELTFSDELGRCVHEAEDLLSAIALTAPRVSPPPDCLERVHRRIQAAGTNRAGALWNRVLHFPAGWPVAACLAVGAGWLFFTLSGNHPVNFHNGNESAGGVSSVASPAGSDDVDGSGQENAAPDESSGGSVLAAEGPAGVAQDGGERQIEYRLRQNLEVLKQDLEKLSRMHDARFLTVPGLARMVVMEMNHPGVAGIAEDDSGANLGDALGDILSDGLLAGSPATPGGAGDRFNFGGDFDGIEDDKFDSGDGLGDFAGSETEPPPVPADDDPALDPGAQPDPGVPDDAGDVAEVRGFTLFDETTGEGSIILQDLPAAEDKDYQLWMVNSQDGASVSVGLLPELEDGEGRVFFELGTEGIMPSGFFITEEVTGGSAIPSDQVILQGPGSDDASPENSPSENIMRNPDESPDP